jgi:hypothetical protein
LKKKIIASLMALVMLMTPMTVFGAFSETLTVTDVDAVLTQARGLFRNVGGTSYVPLRYAAESLGASVSWLSNTRTAVVDMGGGVSVSLGVNADRTLTVVQSSDASLIGLSFPGYIMDDRIMIPVPGEINAFLSMNAMELITAVVVEAEANRAEILGLLQMGGFSNFSFSVSPEGLTVTVE